ncbi:hypothetical protein B0H94_11526 [Salsuginibacillus halophilus]|uniref:Small multi-drug export protein n=1 Tax=Salsuginibacillus halophilus TaxID=517424 RepID=A0A2P8H881_9BACI|nr:hypothetical protein [Salsuginibacillus halophilus]PSL42422.1 hypothetical protein B0H94_11526 [Salsuginibacillus halophilus]
MDSLFLQYMFVFFVSMVPFLEVFLTVPTAIIVFDFPPVIVSVVAIAGNTLSVLLFIFFGTEINKFFSTLYNKLRKRDSIPKEVNPRVKQALDRFGATWVCFLSSILFSSQVGAGTMTTLGSSRKQVFIWTNLGVAALAITMALLSITAERLVIEMVDL